MHFIFEDIAREFGAGALGRGLEYFGKGKVRSVARDGDTMLGEVAGSGANVYRQVICIDADDGVVDHVLATEPLHYLDRRPAR